MWSWRVASNTPKCPEVTFVALGRWWRICFGLTFKRKVFRYHRFHGHRLWAVRLWQVGHPLDSRILLLQTRAAAPYDQRFRVRT